MPMVMERDELLVMAMLMIERCAQCARRGPHGEWVLLLDEPRHDHTPGGDPVRGSMIGSDFLTELAAAAKTKRPTITEVATPDPAKHEVKPDAMVEWNTRPVDPAWLDRCEVLAEMAAKQLNAFTVLVAVQELGKMGITSGGEKLPGPELDEVRAMAKDMPRFLALLSRVVYDELGDKPDGGTVQ